MLQLIRDAQCSLRFEFYEAIKITDKMNLQVLALRPNQITIKPSGDIMLSYHK